MAADKYQVECLKISLFPLHEEYPDIEEEEK